MYEDRLLCAEACPSQRFHSNMPVRFSIVMTVFEPFDLLRRALSCVVQQRHAEWELLLLVDGPMPERRDNPEHLARQLRRHAPNNRIEVAALPRAEGCWGNVGRRHGLDLARGEYVCWINHDNLIAPDYLSAHAENIENKPGCLSVVEVDLWKGDRFFGRYPRRLAASKIDLLCFAVPLQTARDVDAFGEAMQRVYAADWLVFDACRKRLPVVERRGVVGTHF